MPYKRIQERVQEHLTEVKRRDDAHLKTRKKSRWLVFSTGIVIGMPIAGLCGLGKVSSIAILPFLVLLSGILFLVCSVRNAGIIESMVVYNAGMIIAVMGAHKVGLIAPPDAILFGVVLLILIGMAISYLLGWVRSQPK